MKRTLLQYFLFILIFISYTSCVSKKKYIELKNTTDETKTTFDGKIQKLSHENDSLIAALNKKDTIIDSLINVNTSFKKDKKTIYTKKASTLNKDQEYDKKAQFLYNFGAYIEWPVEYNGTDFVIGVAGDADVLKRVQAAIGTKKVKGKKIRIEKYTQGAKYNIVYVTSSKTADFQTIKENSKNNKAIFVCDDQLLYATGSHIVFVMDEDKVRYLLNKISIEKAGLKVSQELMRFSG